MLIHFINEEIKLNRIKSTLLNCSAVLGVLSTSVLATNEFTAPAMVNIPSGTFMMGSDLHKESAKPRHQVTLDKFQMGKYPITVAEFRQFVNATGHQTTNKCNDKLSKTWLSSGDGNANWQNNRYQHSDYQPVVCVSWHDANAYAKWISDKTGKEFRLPTEQEWEYATRANTTSRFFWGDDLAFDESCEYANLGDQTSEYIASKEYGASYVGFIGHVNCNDYEPYNSIVGLYRPNPWGLFDMVGNVKQFMGNCFYQSNKVYSQQEMFDETCERVAFRGTIWHFLPELHTARGGYPKANTPNAILGFRLASNGHSNKVAKSTQSFEQQLKQAQTHRIATRVKIPPIPRDLQQKKQGENFAEISWQLSENKSAIGYDIYQSKVPFAHNLTGFYKEHYQLVESVSKLQNVVKVSSKEKGVSYRVVAKTKTAESLPSRPIVFERNEVQRLPAQISMSQAKNLREVNLRHRVAKDDRAELYYLIRYTSDEQTTSKFDIGVNVEKSGWYQLNYYGRTDLNKKIFFNLWRGNQRVGQIAFDKDIDDTTSKRHKVFLEAGSYDLQVTVNREKPDLWRLAWIKFTEL